MMFFVVLDDGITTAFERTLAEFAFQLLVVAVLTASCRDSKPTLDDGRTPADRDILPRQSAVDPDEAGLPRGGNPGTGATAPSRSLVHTGERLRKWYIVGPSDARDPALYRTEISWPIMSAGEKL